MMNRPLFNTWLVFRKRVWIVVGVLFLLIISPAYIAANDSFKPDKSEEQAAFALLNKIRQNPSAYTKDYGVNLDTVEARPALVWNDTLAKVAETKVIDMATRGYFAHVDPDGCGINYYVNKAGYKLEEKWVKDKKLNYFESIQAGAHDGADAVKALIIDTYSKDLGHRKALLGMTKFQKGTTDIGIGFIRCTDGCKYHSYTSIVIAKHKN